MMLFRCLILLVILNANFALAKRVPTRKAGAKIESIVQKKSSVFAKRGKQSEKIVWPWAYLPERPRDSFRDPEGIGVSPYSQCDPNNWYSTPGCGSRRPAQRFLGRF